MFEVRDLSVGAAVRQATFRVHRGEIAVVTGDAGATVLLRAVAGLAMPTTGFVRLHGDDLTGLSPRAVAAYGVTYVGPETAPFADLTVCENLIAAGAASYVRGRLDRADSVLAAVPRLASLAAARAGALEERDRAVLAIGMALARRPRMLLLETPSARVGEAYDDVLRALRLAPVEDLVTLVAEPGEAAVDPAVFDGAYVVRRGRVRAWPPTPAPTSAPTS